MVGREVGLISALELLIELSVNVFLVFQVEKMIAGCRLMPRELLEENEKERRLGKVDSSNPYLQDLGVCLLSLELLESWGELCCAWFSFLLFNIIPSRGVGDGFVQVNRLSRRRLAKVRA